MSKIRKQLEEFSGSDLVNLQLVYLRQSALLAERFGDLDAAIESSEELARLRADDPLPHLALARLLSRRGNSEGAMQALAKCSELAEGFGNRLILAALAAKGYLPKDEDERTHRLKDAVVVYRETLRRLSFEEAPKHYAVAQRTFVRLCRHVAGHLTGSARAGLLQEVAGVCREGLKVYTHDAFPEEHGHLLQELEAIEVSLNEEDKGEC
jgi:tetratricopeptide (TPR) repeat protein